MIADKMDIDGEERIILDLSEKEAIALMTMAYYHEDGRYNAFVNRKMAGAEVFYRPLANIGIVADTEKIPDEKDTTSWRI